MNQYFVSVGGNEIVIAKLFLCRLQSHPILRSSRDDHSTATTQSSFNAINRFLRDVGDAAVDMLPPSFISTY